MENQRGYPESNGHATASGTFARLFTECFSSFDRSTFFAIGPVPRYSDLGGVHLPGFQSDGTNRSTREVGKEALSPRRMAGRLRSLPRVLSQGRSPFRDTRDAFAFWFVPLPISGCSAQRNLAFQPIFVGAERTQCRPLRPPKEPVGADKTPPHFPSQRPTTRSSPFRSRFPRRVVREGRASLPPRSVSVWDSGSLAVTKEIAFAFCSTAGVRCFSSAGGSTSCRPHDGPTPLVRSSLFSPPSSSSLCSSFAAGLPFGPFRDLSSSPHRGRRRTTHKLLWRCGLFRRIQTHAEPERERKRERERQAERALRAPVQ